MYHIFYLAIIGSILSLNIWQTKAQVAWENTYTHIDAVDAVALKSGDYIMAGNTNTLNAAYLMCLNPEGTTKWTNIITVDSIDFLWIRAMVATSDKGFAIAGNSINGDVVFIKTNQQGNVVWTQTYALGLSVISWDLTETNEGSFLITGSVETNELLNNGFLMKINAEGEILWTQFYQQNDALYLYSVAIGNDQSYYLTGANFIDGNSYAYCAKTTINGDILWTQSSGPGAAYEGIIDNNGDFVVAGNLNNLLYISKFNSSGNEIWLNNFDNDTIKYASAVYQVIQTNNNDYAIVTNLFNSDNLGDVFLVNTTNEGELNWFQNYGQKNSDYVQFAYCGIQTNDNGFFIAGSSEVYTSYFSDNYAFAIKTTDTGKSYTNTIEGYVFLDDNTNCLNDGDDISLPNWMVQIIAINTNDTIYTTTDKNGFYQLHVDSGVYNVSLIPYNYLFNSTCGGSFDGIEMNNYDHVSINFGVNAIYNCPSISVNMSTPFLRRCFDNVYSITYCNNGTQNATESYVEINFDPFLTMVNSSLPAMFLGENNTYRFNIGDIAVGDCGRFSVTVNVDCDDTLLGQTHCNEAHAYPDNICAPPDPTWDGASIEVNGTCVEDSIIFVIENSGEGDMTGDSDFYIYEDDVMKVAGTFQLNSGITIEKIQGATGGTFRLEADQSPGHPGESYPKVTIEGCGSSADISLGFVNNVLPNDLDPFIDIDCQENIGPLDDNWKSVVPQGVYDAHYITNTNKLDYKIRFQNTGTDTAFNATIIDTLSAFLDISSLTLGASSHNYTFEIIDNQILQWNLYNILLPDSTTNETQSHGFVQFSAKQINGNIPGIIIENKAEVYFDFNDAEHTNLVFNTIEENFWIIDVSIPEILIDEISLSVFPNPFEQSVTFQFNQHPYNNLTLKIYNTIGQTVQYYHIGAQQKFIIERNNMIPGIYVYHITNNHNSVAYGKINVR